MFEQSLIESGGQNKTRRALTMVISLALQAALVGLAVLIPLLVTQALPTTELTTMLVAPPPPPPPPPPAGAPDVKPAHVQKTGPVKPDTLQTPVKIPQKVKVVQDQQATPGPATPSTVAGVVGGVPGGVPGGQVGGVIGGVLNSTGPATARLAQKIRVSQGVSEGLLVHKVTPEYPPMAREARVQGTVVLQAEISKDGQITNVQVLQGPPMLAASAVDAVKQWRYRPYNLNGQPTSIETTITVNFRLNS